MFCCVPCLRFAKCYVVARQQVLLTSEPLMPQPSYEPKTRRRLQTCQTNRRHRLRLFAALQATTRRWWAVRRPPSCPSARRSSPRPSAWRCQHTKPRPRVGMGMVGSMCRLGDALGWCQNWDLDSQRWWVVLLGFLSNAPKCPKTQAQALGLFDGRRRSAMFLFSFWCSDVM